MLNSSTFSRCHTTIIRIFKTEFFQTKRIFKLEFSCLISKLSHFEKEFIEFELKCLIRNVLIFPIFYRIGITVYCVTQSVKRSRPLNQQNNTLEEASPLEKSCLGSTKSRFLGVHLSAISFRAVSLIKRNHRLQNPKIKDMEVVKWQLGKCKL